MTQYHLTLTFKWSSDVIKTPDYLSGSNKEYRTLNQSTSPPFGNGEGHFLQGDTSTLEVAREGSAGVPTQVTFYFSYPSGSDSSQYEKNPFGYSEDGIISSQPSYELKEAGKVWVPKQGTQTGITFREHLKKGSTATHAKWHFYVILEVAPDSSQKPGTNPQYFLWDPELIVDPYNVSEPSS